MTMDMWRDDKKPIANDEQCAFCWARGNSIAVAGTTKNHFQFRVCQYCLTPFRIVVATNSRRLIDLSLDGLVNYMAGVPKQ